MDTAPETGLGRFVVGEEHWGGSTVDHEDSGVCSLLTVLESI